MNVEGEREEGEKTAGRGGRRRWKERDRNKFGKWQGSRLQAVSLSLSLSRSLTLRIGIGERASKGLSSGDLLDLADSQDTATGQKRWNSKENPILCQRRSLTTPFSSHDLCALPDARSAFQNSHCYLGLSFVEVCLPCFQITGIIALCAI